MSACKYYDCGWCYAPDYLKTNAVQGGCFEPEHCPSQMTDLKFTSPSGETTIKVQDTGRLGTVAPKTQLHIKMDEPVQYETPMTENEEEIEKVKAQIKVLEKKLSFLEELEKQPKMTLANSGEFAVVSYNYKLYYRFEYPDSGNFSWYKTQDVPKGYVTGVFEPVTDAETERLLEGLYYNHIEVKKEKEQRQKELVREGVKWCEENPDKDPLDWLKPQTPEQKFKEIPELLDQLDALSEFHPLPTVVWRDIRKLMFLSYDKGYSKGEYDTHMKYAGTD